MSGGLRSGIVSIFVRVGILIALALVALGALIYGIFRWIL
jgi:hypothetical protein